MRREGRAAVVRLLRWIRHPEPNRLKASNAYFTISTEAGTSPLLAAAPCCAVGAGAFLPAFRRIDSVEADSLAVYFDGDGIREEPGPLQFLEPVVDGTRARRRPYIDLRHGGEAFGQWFAVPSAGSDLQNATAAA